MKTTKCFLALRDALAHASIPPGDLQLVLEDDAAKTFFVRAETAIATDPLTKGLKAGYYGATLQLDGVATRAQVSRAVLLAYRETLGRVSYDDTTKEPGKSAGQEPPPKVRWAPPGSEKAP